MQQPGPDLSEEGEEGGSSTLSYVGVGADVDEPVEAETDATVGARDREPVRAVRVDDRQTNEAPLTHRKKFSSQEFVAAVIFVFVFFSLSMNEGGCCVRYSLPD